MANGHGGARVPRQGAAVSGPGALSARTDGPMSQPQPGAALPNRPPSGAGGGGGNPMAGLVGLGEESRLADVPVTDGAAFGEGAGLDALGLPQSPSQEARADVQTLHPGLVKAMVRASMRDDATPSLKRLVNKMLANQ